MLRLSSTEECLGLTLIYPVFCEITILSVSRSGVVHSDSAGVELVVVLPTDELDVFVDEGVSEILRLASSSRIFCKSFRLVLLFFLSFRSLRNWSFSSLDFGPRGLLLPLELVSSTLVARLSAELESSSSTLISSLTSSISLTSSTSLFKSLSVVSADFLAVVRGGEGSGLAVSLSGTSVSASRFLPASFWPSRFR